MRIQTFAASGTQELSEGPAEMANGTCGDNLTWVLDSTGVLTISGTGPMENFFDPPAPWYDYQADIKSVKIGNGVTSISDYAFERRSSLTSVKFMGSAPSFGEAWVFGGVTASVLPGKQSHLDGGCDAGL